MIGKKCFLVVLAFCVFACQSGGWTGIDGGKDSQIALEMGWPDIGTCDGLDGNTPKLDTAPPEVIQLEGTIRDFLEMHPDFQYDPIGAETGIVEKKLGSDGKPVYKGGNGTAEGNNTTTGETNFNQWFNDVPGVNQKTQLEIDLHRGEKGVYTYDNPSFFPIDNKLFGNEGNPHNFHFTFELHTEFVYRGGEVFKFSGDDDLWVFVNGELAIDLGGIHAPMSRTITLDQAYQVLHLKIGEKYKLDLFFAERHLSASNFRIDTTIENLVTREQ
ncbi:MAG: fibro-slime domain-containing protein [Pseudomonadota bacterium]